MREKDITERPRIGSAKLRQCQKVRFFTEMRDTYSPVVEQFGVAVRRLATPH